MFRLSRLRWLWYTSGVTTEERLVELESENRFLREQLASAHQLIVELRERIVELERQLAERGGGPPPFVKPNRPKPEGPKPPRKKRDSKHNHARKLESPTRTVRHVHDRCPTCSYQLRGETVSRTRQVIELPAPQPVEVIEHQVIERYCPHCERWQSPTLDLTGQVLGQGRMGVRLISLVAYLRTSLRLPVRTIRSYLEAVHGFTVSVGEIVYLLDRMREATEATVSGLRDQACRGAILHADETGWREDGQGGYIWAFSTSGSGEEAVRYYEFDASRAQAVVKRILGEEFHGHLVSDFYVGYNDYGCKKQRCWSHLLRDLHELKEKHSEHSDALKWAQAVRALYDEAQEWLAHNPEPTQEQREREYIRLVGCSHELGLEHPRDKKHPCWALAKRILRHEDELFQFVLVEGLSPNNNLAERSIRPMVVIRKISGGSRSPNGTKTRMALASLFETWKARGLNPFTQCLRLLSSPTTASIS